MPGPSRTTLLAIIVLTGSLVRPLAAQDALVNAKTLYANAAYEDALKVLDQVAVSETSPEVHQYRALCLIALGRSEAAERAIAIVVAANPFFALDSHEIAPRVVAMFAETRRKILPEIIRRAFTEAKDLFQAGDRQRASQRFDDVLRLLDDVMPSNTADLAALKLLATGFVDLMRAEQTSQPTRTTPASTTSTAAGERPGTVDTPPIPISQVLPPWRAWDDQSARRSYSGAIKVTIDVNGKVTSAIMERKVNASYDSAVLDAASRWLYKPATRDGQPVSSEKTIEIRLTPALSN